MTASQGRLQEPAERLVCVETVVGIAKVQSRKGLRARIEPER
jgi:hypothetical protein